jgi:ribosomal-protein-alanine N-acetyltransferase
MSVLAHRETLTVQPTHSIYGEAVELRPIDQKHADGPYVSWLRDEKVTRFLEARFTDYDNARLRDYIRAENERLNAVLFGIFLTAGDRFIGTIKLSQIRIGHRNCEIGLMIGDKTEWGKGYATVAIRLACRYAFDSLKLHKVTAGCYSDNPSSARAFLKAGFTQEGRLRDDRISKDGWVDCLLLSCLNPADVAGSHNSCS